MDNFVNILQDKLGPIAAKLNANRYLASIRDGFMGVMSLLILGSIFLLLAALPLPGYADFMASVFGPDWSQFFLIPFNMTMSIMTIYVVIGIARGMAQQYKVDELASMLWALAGFLILTPVGSFDGGSYLPMGNFGAGGLFLGMISAILAVEIINFVYSRGWKIKMPDTVPSNVSRSFDALTPGIFIMVIFTLINLLFKATPYETANNFIFTFIQTPLTALGASLPATVLVLLIETLLFSFGLHGPNIVGGVMQPIWLTLTAENAAAFAAGEALPNIVNYQFYSNYVKLGGCGATIGLAILCLIAAKSTQYKTLGKLAIGPAIFNINEPLIFGVPIVLNPVMMIPFMITPIVLAIATYFVMSIGLVPLANGANIPWTTPPVVAGLIIGGWKGALWQVVEILISVAIFFPFFKMQDNKAYQEELETPAE